MCYAKRFLAVFARTNTRNDDTKEGMGFQRTRTPLTKLFICHVVYDWIYIYIYNIYKLCIQTACYCSVMQTKLFILLMSLGITSYNYIYKGAKPLLNLACNENNMPYCVSLLHVYICANTPAIILEQYIFLDEIEVEWGYGRGTGVS